MYRFREPTTLDAEVYYALGVNRDNYFQGHYLKSVEVEKRTEAEAVEIAQRMPQIIKILEDPMENQN